MDDQVRVCKKCNIEKPLTDFVYIKRIDKYKHTCKECMNKYYRDSGYHKAYYQKNKEQRKEYNKQYMQDEKNKERVKQYKSEYYKQNKEKIQEYKSEYYKQNEKKIKAKFKKYYKENTEQLKQYQKDYRKTEGNIEKIRATKKIYKNNRLQSDELYKITEQVRNMIRWSFYRKGRKKESKTLDIIGCDYNTFYKYLLQTFKDNYGYEWDGKEPVHIDHIIPLATATTEQEIYDLCYYTNLQLLKAQDNLEKGDKIEYDIKN